MLTSPLSALPAGFRQVASFVVGLFAIAAFVYFVSHTVSHAEVATLLSPTGVTAILLVALATVASVMTTAWAWRQLLQDRMVDVSSRQLTIVLGLTQVAKYLPGNIGHHLARAAVAYRQGISARNVAATLAMEAALTLAAAVAVGTLGYSLAAQPVVAVLAMAVGILAVGYLGAARRFAFLAYTVNVLMLGSGLYAIAITVVPVSLSTVPTFVGAFALAWAGGFIVPGAPAGLGVREGLLVGLLTPTLGSANVLVVVLGFRVATTLGDLLSFGAGAALYLRQTQGRLIGSESDSSA